MNALIHWQTFETVLGRIIIRIKKKKVWIASKTVEWMHSGRYDSVAFPGKNIWIFKKKFLEKFLEKLIVEFLKKTLEIFCKTIENTWKNPTGISEGIFKSITKYFFF